MPTIAANHYVLAVHDVRRSADFYVNVLGFLVVNESPGWIFVKRDNVMIMLGECVDATPPAEMGDHSWYGYFVVDDVDGYYAEVSAKTQGTFYAPTDKPWGMREFGLTTVDGHRLMIGQIL